MLEGLGSPKSFNGLLKIGIIALAVIWLMQFPAQAGTATVNITGNNTANAQTNATCVGIPVCTIIVNSWGNNDSSKNITILDRDVGDTFVFYLDNFTGGRLNEVFYNGTSQMGYFANTSSMLTAPNYSSGQITFTMRNFSNKTILIKPALNANGYNFTWGFFGNLSYTNTPKTTRTVKPVYQGWSTVPAADWQIAMDGSPITTLNTSGVVPGGGSSNSSIKYDLGSVQVISGYVYATLNEANTVSMTIYTSLDNISYTQQASAHFVGAGTKEADIPGNATARYVWIDWYSFAGAVSTFPNIRLYFGS